MVDWTFEVESPCWELTSFSWVFCIQIFASCPSRLVWSSPILVTWITKLQLFLCYLTCVAPGCGGILFFGTSEASFRYLFGLGVSGQVPLWSILFIGGLTSLVRVDVYPN